MTRRDREKFRVETGFEPCFVAWGEAGRTHVCEREENHFGACRCGCGAMYVRTAMPDRVKRSGT